MAAKTKMIASLKTWLVIYPSITLLLYLFGQPMAALPLYQRTLLLTIVLVPWIVFAGLPLLNFILSLLSSKTIKNNK
jgi:antibiotic biosynthesis monooxygenase (ABM) superfamily enzyme